MSELWNLDLKDFLNGLIMAVVGNIVLYLLVTFEELYGLAINGDPFVIKFDWNTILVIGIYSALVYLSKRFISGTTGTVLVK